MHKHIILIATLTAFCAVCRADETHYIATAQTPSQASGASNTPHLVQKVRSPLGKEIDALGQKLVGFSFDCHMADVKIYDALTNLAARVEKLEAAEAARQAARDAAQKRAAERKAKRQDKETAKDTLRNVIKRGQKAAKREGK